MEQDILPATEHDRIVAADIGKRFAQWTDWQVAKVLDGSGDDCGMVQRVARYRLYLTQGIVVPILKEIAAD